MPYRDDLTALEARCAALERQLSEVARELETAQALREQAARSWRAASLLEGLRVASPCNASWDAMSGDHQSRLCAQCDKRVYNLSEMSRAEAEQLVRDKEGDVCVRFHRRADGTVLTADCPVGARKRRVRRLALVAGVGVGAAATACALVAGVTSLGVPTVSPPEQVIQIKRVDPPPALKEPIEGMTMGVIAMPEPPHSRSPKRHR